MARLDPFRPDSISWMELEWDGEPRGFLQLVVVPLTLFTGPDLKF